MKRKYITLLVSVLCLFVFSCNKQKETSGSISFEKNEYKIQIGEELILTPVFSDENMRFEDCVWTNLSTDMADLTVNNLDKSAKVVGKKIGSVIIRVANSLNSSVAVIKVEVGIGTVSNWVAIGNSITKHGITSYWWGDWGMAATERSKDYVHVLNNLLRENFKTEVSFKTINIGGWEKDISGYNKNEMSVNFTGNENLVVMRFGENVPTDDGTYAAYETELTELVKFIKGKCPNATIVVTGNFWTNDRKDVIHKKVAENNNCIWVPLKQFDTANNKSTLNSQVFGDDNKWHLISDGGSVAQGVANHPNNTGMRNIAEAIYKSIIK